ncbi:hypothetical protein PN36_26515 [Candidatus Thiomargarita nelsonii]|uniref:Transmembrane protein n=1 Tax=Candidatus Thiomargarita nelsonii TaxID=1003181 RepID=A0A0A6S6N8_9GAMM|nr:hypothetical protein PN36_26515 [Candidatus Thiomargarita nelsonii]
MFLKKVIALFLILISLYFIPFSYARNIVEEYQIKAVYLFNFALFLSWPRYVFKHPNQPFRICIIGDDPFGIDLDLVIENEKVERRRVIVQRINSIKKSKYCQILFVSQSERSRMANIFTYLRRHPILTVSDMKNFANLGGMIQFFNTPNNKVRFIIVPETVDEAELIASANLLQIARIVHRR